MIPHSCLLQEETPIEMHRTKMRQYQAASRLRQTAHRKLEVATQDKTSQEEKGGVRQ